MERSNMRNTQKVTGWELHLIENACLRNSEER